MKIIGVIVTALFLVVVLSVLFAIPTYYLWNWLVPSILSLREITLFEAWGINFLCGTLFKGSSSSSKE